MKQKIFLIVQFNFPKPFKPEIGAKAHTLHKSLSEQDWIEEVFTASGGVGAGASSIWAFKLDSYSSLDRLFGREDEVSRAYADFFSEMEDVTDMVREEIVFA